MTQADYQLAAEQVGKIRDRRAALHAAIRFAVFFEASKGDHFDRTWFFNTCGFTRRADAPGMA